MNEGQDRDAVERRLDEALAALPRAMEPGRELWPGIAARLEPRAERHEPRRWLPLALAASLVVSLGSALGGAWLGYDYALDRAVPEEAPAPAPDLARMEREYTQARESYFRALALSGEALDPRTREMLRTDLAVLDAAASELHSALAADPQNPLYADALLMTREREMELLQDISSYAMTSL